MSYRAGKTGVAQTAANVAATIVAAEVGLGTLTGDAVLERFNSIRGEVYADLEKLVDADNAVFEAAEAAAPAKSSYTKKNGSSNGGGAITAKSAREVELSFGKFKGVTLGELEQMSAEEAAKYGHGDGDKVGMSYLTWLSTNENNDFIAKRALAIIDDRKAMAS